MKIKCMDSCVSCQFFATYTHGDGGTIGDFYDCDLTKKHFGDKELPFPEWCPLPDAELKTKPEAL